MEHTSYKLIKIRPLIAGVEYAHAVIICIAFILLFFLTASFFFVLAVCAGLYLVARILMVKKPRNWLEDAIAYQFSTKVFTASADRRGGYKA
jgi:type IV secretory pathway VirB3-like protein